MQVLVARVVRVNRDRGVGNDRLGARRRDRDELAGVFAAGVDQRVLHVPEERVLVLVVDLEVAEGAATAGAPVDQTVAAVDQTLREQVDEDVTHCLRRTRVHRELLARPVGRDAEALVLREDALTVATDETPGTLEERLAADVVAADSLFGQLALNQRVHRDRRVVDARQPQGRAALHAPPAHQDVLHRVHHRVAQVQLARQVGRRHDDCVRVATLWHLVRVHRRERTGLLPACVRRSLHGGGVVRLRHLFACRLLVCRHS